MKEYFYKLAMDQDNAPGAIFIKAVLRLLSFVYSAGVRTIVGAYRLGIFRKAHVPKPVISIGNITLGGTGKTPLVESIVHFLGANDIKPVVLIRGYMGSRKMGGQEKILSDEAQSLKRNFPDVPVKVGLDREQQALAALQEGPVDVFVLDDGFQHWRLSRDLDIVAIDCLNGFGNGAVIPRGILREPMGSLKRADVFILTRADQGLKNVEKICATLKKINASALVVTAAHQPISLLDLRGQGSTRALSFLNDRRIAALSAIGNPGSFIESLSSLGARVQKAFSLMDHHIYGIEDINQINLYCQESSIDTLVTTEKDAVKLRPLAEAFDGHLTILVLKINIKFLTGKDELFDRISHLLHR